MRTLTAITLALAAGTVGPALAQDGPAPASNPKLAVHGGGTPEASAYTRVYVPQIIAALEEVRMTGYGWAGPSDGTIDNAKKVSMNPTHLALGQLDILNRLEGEAMEDGTPYRFEVLFDNVGPECAYAVTANPNFRTFGHLRADAWQITVGTGSTDSGSFGTWEVFADIYPELQDARVENVGSALDILDGLANGDVNFGFFVQRPDPQSEVFQKIDELGLQLVPIVDFELEGHGYEFNELKVAHGGLLSSAKFHETACTSVAVIAGDPAHPELEGRDKRRVHEVVDRMTSQLSAEDLQPDLSSWRDMFDSIRSVSADKLDELREASANAMDRARN